MMFLCLAGVVVFAVVCEVGLLLVVLLCDDEGSLGSLQQRRQRGDEGWRGNQASAPSVEVECTDKELWGKMAQKFTPLSVSLCKK